MFARTSRLSIEVLWEEGESKTMANYVLAAVQSQKPRLRGQVKGPWQLVPSGNN